MHPNFTLATKPEAHNSLQVRIIEMKYNSSLKFKDKMLENLNYENKIVLDLNYRNHYTCCSCSNYQYKFELCVFFSVFNKEGIERSLIRVNLHGSRLIPSPKFYLFDFLFLLTINSSVKTFNKFSACWFIHTAFFSSEVLLQEWRCRYPWKMIHVSKE